MTQLLAPVSHYLLAPASILPSHHRHQVRLRTSTVTPSAAGAASSSSPCWGVWEPTFDVCMAAVCFLRRRLLYVLCPSCRLLSRSDIFKPLFKEDYDDFLEKEREAMATGQGVQATW